MATEQLQHCSSVPLNTEANEKCKNKQYSAYESHHNLHNQNDVEQNIGLIMNQKNYKSGFKLSIASCIQNI